MKKRIKKMEPYSAPSIMTRTIMVRRAIMQTSPSRENPEATGEDFGEPIVE